MDVIHNTYEALNEITHAPAFHQDVSKVDKNFSIFVTDLYNSIEDVERRPGPPPEIIAHESTSLREYYHKLNTMFDFKPWILIAILGILTAITGVFLDFFTIYLFNLRMKFTKDENSDVLSFVGFYITGFVMMMLTTSFGVWVSPAVDGSGVPELKSIMSGANTYRYLDFKVFFPKFIGMCTAYGAGLQVGRAGPLVHLSAILSNWLTKQEMFKYLDKNYAQKRSFLAVACGCGASVALSAPITALIFSVEVVMGFYNTSFILRTFWGICWSLIATKLMKFAIIIDPIDPTNFPYYDLDWDIFWFILVAILAALLGVLFLKVAIKFIYLRRSIQSPLFDRYVWAGLTYTLIAVTHFPLRYALQSTRLFYNDAYSSHELVENPNLRDNPIGTFTIYMLVKIVTMPFIFSCNIPFGIFGLPLTLGAIFGRWFAEVMSDIGLMHPISKGAFGVVGSAACLACVIRGVFPAAMLIETTSQIQYGIPICLGVLAAYIVGNAFSLSFFDIPIFLRRLPIMASLMSEDNYSKNAKDLMNSHYPHIFLEARNREIFDMFADMGEINKALIFPICDQDKNVVGSVSIERLINYLMKFEEEEDARMERLLQTTRKGSMMKHRNEHAKWQTIKSFFQKVGTEYEQEKDHEGDSRVVKPSFHLNAIKPKNRNDRPADAEDPIERFWQTPINWDDPSLNFDPSPLTVNSKCYASKIQFLFATTKATCIIVADNGKYLGCITTPEFLKQKA